MLTPWKKCYDQPRQHIEKQRHSFTDFLKVCLVKAMVFPVVMYGCESWTIQKAERRRIDAFSPLDCKEIQPVHPKGNQSWIFILRTYTEAETPVPWPPDVKNWLIWKDADSGKDWRWEEKGTAEDEMVGWHHPLDGHAFEWTPVVGDGHGSLACCSPWGHKELDMTVWLHCLTDCWVFTARPNLPVIPGISWLPPSVVPSPMMKRTSFLVLVLEDLVNFLRTGQPQLLQHQWLGLKMWWWMACLGNEPR